MLTGCKHALDEILDIAEDHTITFWRTLLASKRLDLNAL